LERKTFTGHGATFEEAVDAAAQVALATLPDRNAADALDTVKIESMRLLYGGIAGYIGTREVVVSVTDGAALTSLGPGIAESTLPRLVLALAAAPNEITVDMMPPVRHPQPHRIVLTFEASNPTRTTFEGSAQDSGVVRYTVLCGGKKVAALPEIVMDVVTPVKIDPGKKYVNHAIWNMAEATAFIGQELRVVAEFLPNGQSVATTIRVKVAF